MPLKKLKYQLRKNFRKLLIILGLVGGIGVIIIGSALVKQRTHFDSEAAGVKKICSPKSPDVLCREKKVGQILGGRPSKCVRKGNDKDNEGRPMCIYEDYQAAPQNTQAAPQNTCSDESSRSICRGKKVGAKVQELDVQQTCVQDLGIKYQSNPQPQRDNKDRPKCIFKSDMPPVTQ